MQGGKGSFVVDAAVLVLGVELVRVGGVEGGLFAGGDGGQQMVDVPVGQVALVEVMLGVIAVQVEPGGQEVGRGIAPGAFALDGGNVILDGVHDLIQIVVGVEVFVAVVGHQLDGQVAGGAAHAVQAAVHGLVPQQRLIEKLLRQAEA